MTKEEKVMSILKLAVETHTAYQTAAMTSAKGFTRSEDPMSDIEKMYDKFEALFDKKLAD
ncbi:hypothetical protein LQF95_24645 [Klebsiella quasipneumoniae]|uniref:hypothetical protein n=1 Tax=Klebsiella pneumoniae complex TaxID=3390273 RepID=UPI001FCB4053|nr:MULTISPECIES: hypothetical protein [Klebsiella]HEC2570534.1 hypothetical protein [Raoultella ornithinolytica]MCJ7353940.1 hypothetical protein [Klebsiella quasipneumoniae]MEC4517068.1 hypothetical protein [Klebsiella pneumoniae]HBW4577287.1 hypothetical protein [Klebsiella pneumoniae]HBW4681735.1 hypothetical protein [Klebsiella pneumoniae]